MIGSGYLKLLNQPLLTIGSTVISLYSVLLFLAALLFTWLCTRLSQRFFIRARSRSDPGSAPSLYIIERFTHYLILAIGLIVALSALGIDISHLALLATALSVGIGFGLQSIFNNFFSGIIILLERSLKVGDFIELDNDISGFVQEINIRSTRILTRDNLDVLVPNAEFVSGRVTNWTLGDPTRRLQVPFGVAYGSDKTKVRQAALEAAARVEFTLDEPGREPDVWLVNFGESSLDFQLVVWVDPRKNTRRITMHSAYLWELETSLAEYRINIPFPQRDLHIIPPESAASPAGNAP